MLGRVLPKATEVTEQIYALFCIVPEEATSTPKDPVPAPLTQADRHFRHRDVIEAVTDLVATSRRGRIGLAMQAEIDEVNR